jgi:hypothetical protein
MKMKLIIWFVPFFFLLYFCTEKTNAQSDKNPSIKFSGELPRPFELSLKELKAMPQSEIKGKDRDEKIHNFQGVFLIDLLKKAGLEFGTGLKGKNQAQFILVEAADNYKVIFFSSGDRS